MDSTLNCNKNNCQINLIMSNNEAARIYENIINDVINESRQDFENSGIDEATLQDLRNIWKENLSQTKVAPFSWLPEDRLPVDAPVIPGITDVKKEHDVSGKNFQLEIKDTNGDIARSIEKQRTSELRKEKALASLDSDDINSDLDDSDEDDQGSDEDGEDGDGMIILCLYEKVLRVKNKWKCNLKDGIASINGKDYAFAKATGESEW